MSRKNGRRKANKLQHGNALHPSTLDERMLASAVQERFLDLCDLYMRLKGVELPIPKSLDADIFRWRQMVVRHRGGDWRHTEAELKSLHVVAQWTVDEVRRLRNQESMEIQWEPLQ